MNKRLSSVFVCVALCILFVAALVLWHEISLARPGTTVVHFLDVGQGDGALIVSPSGKQIVIDGGPDLSALRGLGRHMPFFDRTIDLVVLSHPDMDHVFALPELLRRYRVHAALITGVNGTNPRYKEFLALLQEKHVTIIQADPLRDIDVGDGLFLDILWPPPVLFNVTPKKTNDTSILLRAQYGSSSILFTGDMELPEETDILASKQDIRADVLKIAHHGSKTSSSTGILLAVKPSLAIISVSATNTYGHPHPSVMARLKNFGIPVRMTSKEGDITLRLDGK